MGNLQPWRIPCVSAWRIPCVSEVGMIIKNSSLGHEEDKDKITKKKKNGNDLSLSIGLFIMLNFE